MRINSTHVKKFKEKIFKEVYIMDQIKEQKNLSSGR
jgi:hypothetical protein